MKTFTSSLLIAAGSAYSLNEDPALALKFYANSMKFNFQGQDRDSSAPGQFLAGWIYGVSFQQDDIRDALSGCIKTNDDLTNHLYDGMAAYEKMDMDTGKSEMDACMPLFEEVVTDCDAATYAVLKKWADKMFAMFARPDWHDWYMQTFMAHQKEIEGNFMTEFKEWDNKDFFNSGDFHGKSDKIFIDANASQ